MSIRRLRKLRLLHLRVMASDYLGVLGSEPNTDRNLEYLSMQMQKAANMIFADVHQGQAFKLDGLVIGHLTRFEDLREMSTVCLPQFCFVKGQQTDSLNRTVVVGVPVTRAMLRRTHPYTDILDYEPEAAVWENWLGSAV